MQSIGDQVKQMRHAFGMSQQQLAERSGLQQSFIADLENGKRGNLTLPTLHKLAAGLHCQLLTQFVLPKDISVVREEQSDYVARKIISIASNSAAIELQPPSSESLEKQVAELKQALLTQHKSKLWQKI